MAKTNKLISIISSIEEIFEDNYEYEEYFEISNNIAVSDNCPNSIEIELSSSVKKIRLIRPYKGVTKNLVIIQVPVSGSKKLSPKEKEELKEKYIKKYSSIIDKIRLDLRDEFAVRRKMLTNEKERVIISLEVKKKRASGLRKLKIKNIK